MKNRMPSPIFIRLQPSRLLLGLLAVFSILTLASVLAYVAPIWLKILLGLVVILSSTYFVLRDALLQLPASWQTLEVDAKGVLKITNRRGQMIMPQLAATTFTHPNLIVLNFKRGHQAIAPNPLILLTCRDTENYRRLRVWLRWWPHHALDQITVSVDTLENST